MATATVTFACKDAELFMEEVKQKTGRYWSLISIMAHESTRRCSSSTSGFSFPT